MPFKDDDDEERFLNELFAKEPPRPRPTHDTVIPPYITIFAIGILLMIGFHDQPLIATGIGVILLVFDVALYRRRSSEEKQRKKFEQSLKE